MVRNSKEQVFKITKEALREYPVLMNAVAPNTGNLEILFDDLPVKNSALFRLGRSLKLKFATDVEIVKNAKRIFSPAQKTALFVNEYRDPASKVENFDEEEVIDDEESEIELEV